MRPQGVIQNKDLPKMTYQELREVIVEIGPCIESDTGIIVRAEIKRRVARRNTLIAVGGVLVTALVTTIASNWHDFLWWLTHGFRLR